MRKSRFQTAVPELSKLTMAGGKQTLSAEGGIKNSECLGQTEVKHGAAKTNASAET